MFQILLIFWLKPENNTQFAEYFFLLYDLCGKMENVNEVYKNEKTNLN